MQEALTAMKLQTEEQNKKAALNSQKKAELLEQEKRRQAEIHESLKDRVDERAIENEKLRNKLAPLGMVVLEIVSDGNCLYRAVSRQLALQKSPISGDFSSLRNIAATYMRSHPDDFLPYLTTEDGDMLSPAGFQQYLADMVDPAQAVWGGQPEVAALAGALGQPITVHRATGKWNRYFLFFYFLFFIS